MSATGVCSCMTCQTPHHTTDHSCCDERSNRISLSRSSLVKGVYNRQDSVGHPSHRRRPPLEKKRPTEPPTASNASHFTLTHQASMKNGRETERGRRGLGKLVTMIFAVLLAFAPTAESYLSCAMPPTKSSIRSTRYPLTISYQNIFQQECCRTNGSPTLLKQASSSDQGKADESKWTDDDEISLQDTQRRLEQQQEQINQLLHLVSQQQSNPSHHQSSHSTVSTTDDSSSLMDTTSTPSSVSSTSAGPIKVMLFIDGTWLYYSIYGREGDKCAFTRVLGRGWQHRYSIDWTSLPGIICRELSTMIAERQSQEWQKRNPQHQNDPHPPPPVVELVRSSVFTSYKADTSPKSFRYKMFEDLRASNYDVHMMETVGKSEKCVDIQLAVEMLHYATVPQYYDVALILTGDKDFLPAMIRTRQKEGRTVGLVSMKQSCNRALYETAGVKDYNVIWLDDFVEEFVQLQDPSSSASSHLYSPNGDDVTMVVSVFTLTKVLVDFIQASGFDRVSSRDVGRYLKFLQIGNASLSDHLKSVYRGLRNFLSCSDVFVISHRSDGSAGDDSKEFWIGLDPDADDKLLEEAKATTFSPAEKEFFDQYSLRVLEDKDTSYRSTLDDPERHAHGRDHRPPLNDAQLSPPLEQHPKDFSSLSVVELKEVCRERGLKVSGVKAALIERIEADVQEEMARRREVYGDSRREVSASSRQQRIQESGTSLSEVKNYLIMLISEYIQARGGEASSRDVGRYLAANKSSGKSSGHSYALQELKHGFGSLAAFIGMCPEIFDRSDAQSDDGKFAFAIRLKQFARSTNG